MTWSSRWTHRILFAALLGGLCVTAYLLLWTTFMVYDDEGYVLYSLRAYAEHGHLYDQVYTQYGPFFFVLYRTLHALGLVFTNTSGRGLAMGCWIGATAISGRLVWLASRGNLTATIATIGGVFVQLWPMTSEPSHPGGLIALLVAIAAGVGIAPRLSARARNTILGAVTGMLTLTKINVGIFLAASICAWWALSLTEDTRRSRLRWSVAAALAILPVALMHTLFADEWVKIFIAVVAAGSVATVLVAEPNIADRPTRKIVGLATAGGGAVALLTISVVLLTGTKPAELLEGVILGPLRHPTVYEAAFTWRIGTLVLTWAAVPLALWIRTLTPQTRASVVATGRILVVGGYIACATGAWVLDASDFVLSYGVTTAWLFAMRLREDDATHAARGWLALLLILQSLHAFPVAGSQVSWGTFLWVPLAALAIHDLAWIAPSRVTRRFAMAGLLIALAVPCVTYAAIGWRRFRESKPLNVTGAENLRLPEYLASALRMLDANTRTHATVLFSLPGMMSLNLWTNVPPPTIPNATHWFNLLSPEQQDRILQQLQQSPDSAFILQRHVYEFILHHGVPVDTPLVRWLLANYTRTFTADTYEFWVRKGRTIEPVNAARMFKGAANAPTRYKVEITVNPTKVRQVAGIELHRFQGNGTTLLQAWKADDARVIVVPIARDGVPEAGGTEAKFPFPIDRMVKIELFTNAFPSDFNAHAGIIYLRDSHGAKVGEARFIE